MTAHLVPPELLDAVVAHFTPRRIILFGSSARGEAGPNTDIDLLVILDDDAPLDKLTLAAGYESRRSHHGAVDVIPWRDSVFKRKSRIAGPSRSPRLARAGSSISDDESIGIERRREASRSPLSSRGAQRRGDPSVWIASSPRGAQRSSQWR